MAAILNSAILNLATLDSAIIVFPLKLTHTCQDWFPPFAQKNLHSFILTQLDDGSHLEFCHLGFRHFHLGFRHLLIFSQIHSKTLSLHSDSWLKLIQSDSNLFILTQLDDGSHLESCHLEFGHLGFSHLSFSSQTHSQLPGLVPTIWTKKPLLTLPSPPFAQKNLHSFILTQLDDGSHLEFYHVGFRHWHPAFRYLLIFSQIHSKTLSLHSDSWLKLIQSDSNLFILTQLDDGSQLEFCHLAILDSAILVFPLKLTHTCQDWFPPSAQKNLHSFILTQLDDGSHLEFYHVGLRKLHSFILTQLDDGSHLEFCHVGFRHLVFFSQIHS